MQSIERYGVVALVFLAVTVAAVLMWEGDSSSSDTVAAAESDPKAVPGTSNTVLAHTPAQRNRPLRRVDMQEAPAAAPPSSARPSLDELREETRAGISPARTESPPPEGGEPDPREAGDPPVPIGDEMTAPRAPAPHRAERAESTAALNVYVVKADDQTLGHIAMRELGTWRRYTEIVDLNPGLDPEKLRVGARLVMPPAEPKPAPEVAATPPAAPAAETTEETPSGATYRVVENDSLWKIAARTLGDGALWGEIAAVNPEIDVDRLTVGQVLRLPSSDREAAPATRSEPEVASTETPASERRGRVR